MAVACCVAMGNITSKCILRTDTTSNYYLVKCELSISQMHQYDGEKIWYRAKKKQKKIQNKKTTKKTTSENKLKL